ncbi:MAG TPA: protein kinase [Kofleriaceae bacterium]|nr:protein kinase [Kofleriaceae bacterium]
MTGCVGTGGMGVVYSARDPDLDRNIALKVLRPELSVEARSRARLLGEARAMAQLSHPNVVPVYDVGVLDDHVFIAMELVDGVTLRRKLDRATPWRTVVQIYLQAARGLGAAHAAGLVHRDFKPDNVLYGSDGRIRVVDFGLVAADPLDPVPPGSPPRANISAAIETTAGVVLGTPAFMAPEAMRGEVTDPRADQFSFCVALFHGLYGTYPHTGATLAERAEQITRGAIKKPVGSQVPDRVFRVLARGLRARPEDRYPSMDALVAAIEHAVRPRGRRIAAMIAVAAVVLAAAVVAYRIRKARPPLELGPAETIAHSDERPFAVTMLRDGRYLQIDRGEITVVSPDGTQSHPIGAPPGITPLRARVHGDGQVEIQASGAPCSWWLVPINGGAWSHLLDDKACTSQIDLSPDGRQLAIAQGGELRVRTLATGAERVLLHINFEADNGHNPVWSPDGKRIAVGGDVMVVDAASGQIVRHGHIGAAVSWLDPGRIVYVTRNWLRSEIRVLDLKSGTDVVAHDMEGNVIDIVVGTGGLLVRCDEFHGKSYLVSTATTRPLAVSDLTPLDTGSAIDFWPAMWTGDGAVITVAMVAGQRGLVRTVPGQHGAPLVLDRARTIVWLGATPEEIVYMIDRGEHDCETRVFDLKNNKVRQTGIRCSPQPNMTCARITGRCIISDDNGSRWFDPGTLQFQGAAPRMQSEEYLSPSGNLSARIRDKTVVVRDLEAGTERILDVQAPGALEVTWGNDDTSLIVSSSTADRLRILLWNGATWRTVVDDPHRQANGVTMSLDGAQLAIVALLTTSTWSYLPITAQR